jgi:hypothetical protein
MAEDDVLAGVPKHMRDWMKNMPTVRPDEYEAGISEMWERFDEGLCMSCGGQLKSHVTLVVTPIGIVAAFCSGVCATDMAIIGWLQEQHDDLIDRLKFRGGGGDSTTE